MGRALPGSQQLWNVVGAVWLRAALGEIPSRSAIDEVLNATSIDLDVRLAVELGDRENGSEAAHVRRPLFDSKGERLGTLVADDAIDAETENRLATTIARLIELPRSVTLSRGTSHDISNRLASLLANAELLEWLTSNALATGETISLGDLKTLHEASLACRDATRDLVSAMAALRSHRID